LEEPPPTGSPKGAMLTHANLSAATSQYLETTRGDPPVLESRTSSSPCAPMRWRRKTLPSKPCN
jgi:acyl-CoA synthetase (AMP-forming)/AMP-acid ligase II